MNEIAPMTWTPCPNCDNALDICSPYMTKLGWYDQSWTYYCRACKFTLDWSYEYENKKTSFG